MMNFCSTPEQPVEIQPAFSEIAIRFVSDYASTCWLKIIGRLSKPKISTVS